MRTPALLILVLLLALLPLPGHGGEDEGANRFTTLDDSIVLDTKTGLMWAAVDNGSDIDWYDAAAYCDEFRLGGHDDWRMPDIKELASLFSEGKENGDGYFIAAPVTLSSCCLWSSYDTMGGALSFSFKTGKRPVGYMHDSYQLRILPVRGESTINLDAYGNF